MKTIVSTQDILTKRNVINRVSDVPGGISVAVSNLVVGSYVPEGTPVTAPATGVRTVCKQGKILTGSTTTVFKVDTDSNQFKVGDFLGRITGGLAYAITVVTDNGDGTASLTVGTALESATVGEFVYEMAAESAGTTSALLNTPDAITKAAFEVEANMAMLVKDALMRADVVEGCIGDEYLDLLPLIAEIKY